jgi:hypothetical protein
VYGPRQRPDLAINKFTKLMLAGQPIPLYGDGSTQRDYTYVGDIVAGLRAAMGYRRTRFEIVNLGNNHAVSLMELVRELEGVLGLSAVIDRRPEQPGDVSQTWASIEKAKRLLGYDPPPRSRTDCGSLPYGWAPSRLGRCRARSRLPQVFDAVLVVSFGGPQGLDDIRPFPRQRAARPARAARACRRGGASLRAVRRRLAAHRHHEAQADGLEARLRDAGLPLPVYVGMRNWHPFLVDTLRQMHAAGVRRAIGFIAAAQHSYSSCPAVPRERGGSASGAARARRRRGRDVRRQLVRSSRLRRRQRRARAGRARAPRSCAAGLGPPGVHGAQHSSADGRALALRSAAARVVALVARGGRHAGLGAGLPEPQRPAGRPVAGPGRGRISARARADGLQAAVLCPIGFVCDHIECSTIWIRRRQAVCREIGLPMVRAEAVNDDPRFWT